MTSINYGDDKFEVEDEYYIGGILAAACGVVSNPCANNTFEHADWNEVYENAKPVSNTVNWTL